MVESGVDSRDEGLAQLGNIKFHRGFRPLLFFLLLHGEIDINMTTE